jgi:hypothetical protein
MGGEEVQSDGCRLAFAVTKLVVADR